MGNYGIRVSKSGKDVLTDGNSDMAFTTAKSILKAVNWEEKDTDTEGNPIDYNHDAGKVPFLLVYGTRTGTDKILGHYQNIYDMDNVILYVTADSNKVRVYFIRPSGNSKAYFYVFTPEL